MRSSEARKKFKLADQWYREKKYAEALAVLEELDAEFPNAKNVMYPKALCLAKLGRPHEAHELCQKLKAIYDDPRADQLMKKLAAGVQPPPVAGADGEVAFDPIDLDLGDIGVPGGADPMGLDDLFAPKPATAPASPQPQPPSRKPLYIGLGVAGAVILIALLCLPLITGSGTQKESESQGEGGATAGQTAEAPAEIPWYGSYDAAMNASWDKFAPTLLFFYSEDNADAMQMISDTWKEPTIAQLVAGWTCVRIDVKKDPDTASYYEVESTPYTAVEDDAGNTVWSKQGFVSANEFYEAIAPLDLKVYKQPEITAFTAILLLLLGLAQSAGGLYLTLLIVKKLPHDEFLKDIISVSLVGIGASAVAGLCPCIGIFIAVYILHQAYEMEFFDFIALLAINMILGAITTVLAAAILGIPYSELIGIASNY